MNRVLIVGDHPDFKGGISSVMRNLRESYDGKFLLDFVDPLQYKYGKYAGFFPIILLILRNRPQLIHFNIASNGNTKRALVICTLARLLNIPYVIHLHGGGYPRFISGSPKKLRRKIQTFFSKASTVIVLSNVWRDYIIEEFSVDESHTQVIANSSQPTLINRNKTKIPTIIYVGRITQQKGIPELVEAIEAVQKDYLFKAIFVGSQKDELSRKMLENTEADIYETGELNNSEVLSLIAESWVLVLPSRAENQPMSIIEAMSVGTAVIATKVGGIPETITDSVEGLLVELDDQTGLVAAIERLVKNERLALDMGAAGKIRWKSEHNQINMNKNLDNIWRKAYEKLSSK